MAGSSTRSRPARPTCRSADTDSSLAAVPTILRHGFLSIALLPGDGVGPEVIAEARKAVDALGLDLAWTELPWGTDHFHASTATMMPDGRARRLRAARRDPARRRRRPVRARPRHALGTAPAAPPAPRPVGEPPPGAAARGRARRRSRARPAASTCSSCARTPRASTRASAGARTRGFEHEVGDRDERLHARGRASASSSYAFELAEQRRGVLTSATKSNASRYGYVLWDEVAEEVAAEHPGRALRARARRRARGAHGQQPAQPRRRRRLEPLRRHPHRHRRRAAGRDGHGRERERRPRRRARRRSSSPCTARRPTSPARGSRTRSARSGARR